MPELEWTHPTSFSDDQPAPEVMHMEPIISKQRNGLCFAMSRIAGRAEPIVDTARLGSSSWAPCRVPVVHLACCDATIKVA